MSESLRVTQLCSPNSSPYFSSALPGCHCPWSSQLSAHLTLLAEGREVWLQWSSLSLVSPNTWVLRVKGLSFIHSSVSTGCLPCIKHFLFKKQSYRASEKISTELISLTPWRARPQILCWRHSGVNLTLSPQGRVTVTLDEYQVNS